MEARSAGRNDPCSMKICAFAFLIVAASSLWAEPGEKQLRLAIKI